jgi:prevent-host-death family protein
MAISANVLEAKTQFSKLLRDVSRGEKVIITNRGKPVAKLTPIIKDNKRMLGFVKGNLPDSFFDPLSDDELDSWQL